MAKEVYATSVKSVVSERTMAFTNPYNSRLPVRANAILNIANRVASLENNYGRSNSERIRRAARRMVERLIESR